MRILAFYPYLPYPLNRGAYHRAFHLLRGLAKENEVDLLALSENNEGSEYKSVFSEFCNQVTIVPFQHPEWEKLFPGRLFNSYPASVAHWTSKAIGESVGATLQQNQYDAVHVLDLVLAQYFHREHRDIPLVLDRTRVDLQYQLMEHKRLKFSLKNRVLNMEHYAKVFAFEKAIAKRCALQVVCGPDDQNFVRRWISKSVPIQVIANGVDLEFFNPESSSESRAERPSIIFCGAMDYTPNVDALRWYFGEIHAGLKRLVPELEVMLVGKDPTTEVRNYARHPGVIVTGSVPDVRPYYKRAWLQIVPLKIGGGTRLKIVESLGMRTPVVSTRIGAQGLDLVHEHDILYADDSAEFIKQTARALSSPELREQLEVNGLNSVQQRLGWKKLGQDLCKAYQQHLGVAAPARGMIGCVAA
jgi:sugar transferase (PEP-CTERM/EpsH1 system associated)